MKAITYDRFGTIDVLQAREIATPKPNKGQVLVAVRASSINVIDSRVRAGAMGPLVSKTFPKIPGADVAGVIAEVGSGVTGLKVGDEVYGAADPLKGGAFAEFIALPADQVASKPRSLSFSDAAAMPIAGLAALLSLRDLGAVKPGDDVLIHGASGAVGLYAIQIAKHMGARVTAVAGTSGLAAVRNFGADTVIDYRTQDGSTFDRRFDVILNASGKMPYAVAKRFLKAGGRMIEPSPSIPVVIGSKIANLFRTRKHQTLITVPRRVDLDALSRMVASGALKPTVAKVVALATVKLGFAEMEKGGVVGKIVVEG